MIPLEQSSHHRGHDEKSDGLRHKNNAAAAIPTSSVVVSLQMTPLQITIPASHRDNNDKNCIMQTNTESASFLVNRSKEWVWENCQELLYNHLQVQLVEVVNGDETIMNSSSFAQDEKEEAKASEENEKADDGDRYAFDSSNAVPLLQKRLSLLEKIAHVQHEYCFLQGRGPRSVYTCLMDGILDLLQCDCGFIGQIMHENDDETTTNHHRMYLQCHATGLRSQTAMEKWSFFSATNDNGNTTVIPDDNGDRHNDDLRLYNMDSLWGRVLTSRQPVISNNCHDDDCVALPLPGHSPWHNFLGLPIHNPNGKLLGMIGIANKSEGDFNDNDVHVLEPFLVTASNIMQAYSQVADHRALVDTLEQKVQARTRKLRQANQYLATAHKRVMEVSALQLQHFACMSHEIRTPLNCILGLSSLLLQEGREQGKWTPMQLESMQMIVSSGDLLLTVVNDVLDYSKLETGNVQVTPKPSNLQETLNALVHSIEMKDTKKGVTVQTFSDVQTPEFVTMDSRRVQQVLYNLLGNALKFSKPGGTIELGVELEMASTAANPQRKEGEEEQGGCKFVYTPKEKHCLLMRNHSNISLISDCELHETENSSIHTCSDFSESNPASSTEFSPCANDGSNNSKRGVLRFRVKDYGKGIECKDFARIFQPFQQASAETEQVYGGTGLGLAVTARLVHAMGGLISVDSVAGEWTEFVVELPFVDAPFDIQALSPDLTPTTVFIVDDNRSSSHQLSKMLQHCGIRVNNFGSTLDMEQFIASSGPLPHDRTFVCFVREDLHDEESFELLRNLASSSALITFGPKYSVRNSLHFRSPNKVLPSVLLRSLREVVIAAQRPGLSRAPSLASIHSIPTFELRVLIAEDNRINQKVLVRMLDRIGVNDVTVVNDGEEAVDECLKNEFDLVFMDMQMPVMDGVEACQEIMRRKEIARKPKIVFVTAHAAHAHEMECLEAGASAFLPKPFNIREIEDCLNSVVNELNDDE